MSFYNKQNSSNTKCRPTIRPIGTISNYLIASDFKVTTYSIYSVHSAKFYVFLRNEFDDICEREVSRQGRKERRQIPGIYNRFPRPGRGRNSSNKAEM